MAVAWIPKALTGKTRARLRSVELTFTSRCTLMIILQSFGWGMFFAAKNISYLSGSSEAPLKKHSRCTLFLLQSFDWGIFFY